MNRTYLRFFSIFSLFFATVLVWQPVRAMNVLHQEDGQTITQEDIDKFRNRTLPEARFLILQPIFEKYDWRIGFVGYGYYLDPQRATPAKLNQFADFFTQKFQDLKATQAPSSATTSAVPPVVQIPRDTSPIIYQDKEIKITITQKDLDDFRNKRLSKERFEEILPTLSDLHDNENNYWRPIDKWTYDDCTNYSQRRIDQAANDIHETIEELKYSMFRKTVTRKHPKHKERAAAAAAQQNTAPTTTASGAPTTTTTAPAAPQQNQNVIYKDKNVTITQADIDNFKNGRLTQKRFDELAPALSEYEPELLGKTYEDYLDMTEQEPEYGKDIINSLSQELQERTKEEAERKKEIEAQKASFIHKITQADIDAFEYNELTEQRFQELVEILRKEGMDVPLTYHQYLNSGNFLRLVGSVGVSAFGGTQALNKSVAENVLPAGVHLLPVLSFLGLDSYLGIDKLGLDKLGLSPKVGQLRSQMMQMLIMYLNMEGARLSMPAKRATVIGALWAATCGITQVALETTADLVGTIASGKNQFTVRTQQQKEKIAKEKAEKDELDTVTRKADEILAKYTDEYIDQLVNKVNPPQLIHTAEQKRRQKIKEQNCMIAGGLIPERIRWDWAHVDMDIGKDVPYPIALYKKDLVYGAGFITKACVSYWTISQLAKYRSRYIYQQVLEHTDEFLTLLKDLDASIKNPPKDTPKRTWKQYALDKISGKGNDSDQLYALKQHIDAHYSYIGYNPLRYPLLGTLAILLFSKAGTAKAYEKLVIEDDSCDESRCAYYKDDAGNLRRLPGLYRPISVTEAAQSLSPSGLFATAVNKIPKTVRDSIPIPLSQKELLEKIEHNTPKRTLDFLKSETMAYIGLFATAVFEIKFMNDLYHARWHQWILAHQEYFIDLLERYQQARTLPEEDETRVQLEEEILLSISEGNMLSGINRATVWRGIANTALNKVTLACTAPIIAYALWHNRKLVGQLSWQATKQLGEYASTGIRMTPIIAKVVAQNPREVAQAVVMIPVGAVYVAGVAAFYAAQAAAIGIAAGTIITGATIAQNKKVQKYGAAAYHVGTQCVELGKTAGSAALYLAQEIAKKCNLKR